MITASIGLEILRDEASELPVAENGTIGFGGRVSPHLRNAWTPRKADYVHSVRSTEQFILGAALNLLVDGVDRYFVALAAPPSPLPDDILEKLAKGWQVSKRVNTVLDYMRRTAEIQSRLGQDPGLADRCSLDLNMFRFARDIRNNWIHTLDGEKISSPSRYFVPSDFAKLSELYRHYDPRETYDRITDGRNDLHIKDLASLYSSAIRLVEVLDQLLIEGRGVRIYCHQVLQWHFEEQARMQKASTREAGLTRSQQGVIRSFLNREADRTEARFRTILAQRAGFPKDWSYEDVAAAPLGQATLDYLSSIISLAPADLEEFLLRSDAV